MLFDLQRFADIKTVKESTGNTVKIFANDGTPSTISGNITVSGTASLGGNTTISGTTTLSGTVTLSGKKTLSNNTTISGSTTVSGPITFQGTVNGLPVATTATAGIVKPGTGVEITNDGTFNVTVQGGGTDDVFSVSNNGLVPKPNTASNELFLSADGQWRAIQTTTISTVQGSQIGMMWLE